MAKKEDGRKNNGGHKTAGRKPKATEQKLVEKLSPLEESALEAFSEALADKQAWAVKLFMQYMYGMPKQTTESHNTHSVVQGLDIKKIFGEDK